MLLNKEIETLTPGKRSQREGANLAFLFNIKIKFPYQQKFVINDFWQKVYIYICVCVCVCVCERVYKYIRVCLEKYRWK